jgi:hypothetical protein
MNFDSLYVNIRFSDDGFCVMQSVTFPEAAQQRVNLKHTWINRFKSVDANTMLASTAAPRTLFPMLRATAPSFYQKQKGMPAPEEVAELLDSTRWGTVGFGEIVSYSPLLGVDGVTNPQIDRKLYILLWLTQHGSDEQLTKSHILLTFYG